MLLRQIKINSLTIDFYGTPLILMALNDILNNFQFIYKNLWIIYMI
jgi:hypothetical protein